VGAGADLVLFAEQEILLASIRDHVQPLENEFDCAADYFSNFTGLIRPYSPTPVNVNCRLKYFVTLVTYCYNNVFVYFNLQLTLTGVGEYGPK
jgi:hypothetical protein